MSIITSRMGPLSPPHAGPPSPGSTGVFWYSAAYGIQSITDGTSNTVAFSEGLTGSNGTAKSKLHHRRESERTARLLGRLVDNPVGSSPPGPVIGPWLQTCNANWSTASAASMTLSTNRGWLWAWGMETITMFNTIVPPNSTQYQWASCRNGCGGACDVVSRITGTSRRPPVTILAAVT